MSTYISSMALNNRLISKSIYYLFFYTLLTTIPSLCYGQNQQEKRIIYVDNSTIESDNPQKVEIEFSFAKCIETNLDKKDMILYGKSRFRILSNISKKDCRISGKIDFEDCQSYINTISFNKNLDDKQSLAFDNENNTFKGIRVTKIYDVTFSGCEAPAPAKEDPNKVYNYIYTTPLTQFDETQKKGFYFFCAFKAFNNGGKITQLFTPPLYIEGNMPEDDKVRQTVLTTFEKQIKDAVYAEAKKILEETKRKNISDIEIEKKAQQLLSQIKDNPQESIYIWTKTPQMNYLARTLRQSQDQMQEIISGMEMTLDGLGIEGEQSSSVSNYRYIILTNPSSLDLKFTPRNKKAAAIGRRG